ncbi:hypothetical protein [Halovivax gelatinilyticus]|uniref:hypothetical protein n=1 Tax=Halovivax gelatinilyticus TaxID=2961597 RepID=UPI0020CA73BA|nr:hypothetical protein [Halovivax gelatinilyticus]
MDLSPIRLRYHLVNTTIVIAVLLAYQSSRSSVDVVLLLAVAVIYLAIVIAIDLVRPLESNEET